MRLTRRSLLQLGGAALAAGAAPGKPDVLTIISDQLNPSVTSAYGGPVSTPNLERLARRGVVFTNASCPTPFCSPSRASIVTGQYPHRHGIVYNVSRIDYPAIHSKAVDEGILTGDTTADKVLNARGYATHQYGKWHLSGDALSYYPDQYGECREYAREMAAFFAEVGKRPHDEWMNWYGWILPVTVDSRYRATWEAGDPILRNRYSDFIVKMGRLNMPRGDLFDVRVADRTVQRLRALDQRPFSMTCSLMWPHDPNVVPMPYYETSDPEKIELRGNAAIREHRFENDLSRQMVARHPEVRLREFLRIYYGTVRLIDDQVGRVLDALDQSGRADNTIIIFTADHGDMASGHGMAWKSTTAFYDEIVRVPLIFSWPGHIQPGKSDAAASLVDLAPTILDLTGHPIPSTMQGSSLAPLLLGRSSAARHVYGFSERVQANPQHTRQLGADSKSELMIRGDGWKYAVYSDGEEFLYNLTRDPGETRNLAGERNLQNRKRDLRREIDAWLERTEYPGNQVSRR
jgi:arylsulfatase A-like enzyme